MAPLVFWLKGGSTVAHEKWAEAYLDLLHPETEEEWAFRAMDWMADHGVEDIPAAVLIHLDDFFFGDLIAAEAAVAVAALSLEPAAKRLCSRDDSTILVRVCPLRGKAFEVAARGSGTVRSLKQAVEARSQVPVEHQALYLGGRLLLDGDILGGVGVVDGSSVHLVLRLRGGSTA
jgi:hypothetical protein